MARTKIAPVLQMWEYQFHSALHPKDCARARAELRALLAVARAARPLIDPEDRGDPQLIPEWKRLDRALARLDRLSRRKP